MSGTDRTAVSDIHYSDDEYSFTVSGRFGEHRVRFWGDIPEHAGAPRVEPALAVALLPAMAAGGELSVPGALSPRLRQALPDVQAVLNFLSSESALVEDPLQQVNVLSDAFDAESPPAEAPGGGVGAFFSGGVDSWATLLDNPDVSDAIYVHGFDIPIDQPDVSAMVEARLVDAVAREGRRLRVVRTNVRELLDPSADWMIAHGAAMAAVALLVAPACGRVLVPASDTYAEQNPRGTHPLLDHLWSTEWCRIEHHGAYLPRPAKTERVAKCQDALDTLRVCWREVDRYNCGRCEKCVRTMVTLEALGALERCSAFAVDLNLDQVASLPVHDLSLLSFWAQTLEFVRKCGGRPDLEEAVETCLARNRPQSKDETHVRAELEKILNSQSWRLTAPLRRLGGAARRPRRNKGGS